MLSLVLYLVITAIPIWICLYVVVLVFPDFENLRPTVFKLAMLAVFLQVLWHRYGPPPKRLNYASLATVPSNSNPSGRPCFGSDSCVLLLVAPWCPVCASHIGCFREVLSNVQDASAFIGGDQLPKLEAMAGKIGSKTFIDERDLFHKLRVEQFPTWVVLDSVGNVSKRFSGVPEPCNLASIKGVLGLK